MRLMKAIIGILLKSHKKPVRQVKSEIEKIWKDYDSMGIPKEGNLNIK